MSTFGNTGSDVPRIGQGTWMMERDGEAAAAAALRAGLDAGLRHIDTAEMYGDGEVERIVGEALAGRRGEVYLVSKVLPSNASRAGVIEAAERSLRALQTDHLDCYLLHWPSAEPLEETIAGFEDLVESGKIRAWGVSNFDVDALEEAERIAPGRMACNQVLYHLDERRIENDVMPWCREHGVALVGYSPFGQGNFVAEGTLGHDVLSSIAQRRGVTTRQVALAFLTREPHAFAIPKATRLEHVRDNAGALELELSPEEIADIDAALPAAIGGGLPTL